MKLLKTSLYTGLALLMFNVSQAQSEKKIKANSEISSITRSTSNYNQIKLAGAMDFNLIEGKEGEITIKGASNLLDYIVTKTKGDQLIIRFKNNVNIDYSNEKIEITIPYTDINYLSLDGSGDVTGSSVITAKHFTTKLAGSGDIDLKIESNSAHVEVTGSGDIALIGQTNNLKASVIGSGDFHGKKLTSTNADLKVTGYGTIESTVSNNLEATVIGSGNINYFGNPKDTNNKVIGSGLISKKK